MFETLPNFIWDLLNAINGDFKGEVDIVSDVYIYSYSDVSDTPVFHRFESRIIIPDRVVRIDYVSGHLMGLKTFRRKR